MDEESIFRYLHLKHLLRLSLQRILQFHPGLGNPISFQECDYYYYGGKKQNLTCKRLYSFGFEYQKLD